MAAKVLIYFPLGSFFYFDKGNFFACLWENKKKNIAKVVLHFISSPFDSFSDVLRAILLQRQM